MTCGARWKDGNEFYCLACRTSWTSEAPKACGRQMEGSKDPKLTATEIKGLRLASGAWLNKCHGGYRVRGSPRVSNETAGALLALSLCYRAASGALRSTRYGDAWLAKHAGARSAVLK